MPTFQWSGRDRKGNLASGMIDAASEEQALANLRKAKISLTSIKRISKTAANTATATFPKPAKRSTGGAPTRIVLALILLIGAALILSISHGSRIQCDTIVKGNPYVCTIQTNIAGFYLLDQQRVKDATSAIAERKTEGGYDEQHGYSSLKKTRVVIKGSVNSIATEWMAYPFESSESAAQKLNEQFDIRGVPSFHIRQVESAPIALAALMVIIAIWSFTSAVHRLRNS